MANGILMVTPLYAGLLALLFIAMAWRVVRLRQSSRTAFGDGGSVDLLRVIRGHGNFAEYVPLALLLLALLELGRMSIYVLHALGLALLIARVMHAAALSFGNRFKWRVRGAGLTFAVIVVEAVLCLYVAVHGHWAWFAL
jgi:uncharacterized membrane protein YecN with MAPEG domain